MVLNSILSGDQRPPPLALKEKYLGAPLKDGKGGQDDLVPYLAIYLENPDGSLSLGLPPDMKLPEPPTSPRQRTMPDLSSIPSLVDMPWAASQLGGSSSARAQVGSVIAFQKHERLLFGLLVLELVVEVVYLLMLYHGSRHSVKEVASAYQVLPVESLWMLFWLQLACELSYLKLYFCLGFSALAKHKPRMYSWFANVALGGIIVQVLFSYMNKANILVFALRLFSYVYARFMKGMLHQIMLRPLALDV
eukprot:gb/GFBE01027859.1/.p1 GENE.gb/GFBE01027859.1/~~gb/GFBE01027859.1/.p1  ORF type:complete len:249 (+),score=46.17 gb/GFBE01027859.1/:1-747(+)